MLPNEARRNPEGIQRDSRRTVEKAGNSNFIKLLFKYPSISGAKIGKIALKYGGGPSRGRGGETERTTVNRQSRNRSGHDQIYYADSRGSRGAASNNLRVFSNASWNRAASNRLNSSPFPHPPPVGVPLAPLPLSTGEPAILLRPRHVDRRMPPC